MVGLLDPAYLAVWKLMQQVALLSQKGRVMLRVIEYFAKSPKVTRNDTVECKSVSTETVYRTVYACSLKSVRLFVCLLPNLITRLFENE